MRTFAALFAFVALAAEPSKEVMQEKWMRVNAQLEALQAKANAELTVAKNEIDVKYRPQGEPLFKEINDLRVKLCADAKVELAKCDIDPKTGHASEVKPPAPTPTNTK